MGSPVTHRVSYGEVLSYLPRAMFKPGIMILLLAVLTVHVVQIAGLDEDSMLHRHRILPTCLKENQRECRPPHATATGGTQALGRVSFAVPPPRCPAYHCVASITKQCCLRPRNKRGKHVPCRFVHSC